MEFASFIFLDEEISLGQIDVHAIHMTYRHLHDPGHPFAPLYLTGKQVLASGGEREVYAALLEPLADIRFGVCAKGA